MEELQVNANNTKLQIASADTSAGPDRSVCSNGQDRQKFEEYWKSAVEEFGLSDDGMMLRKSVISEGIAQADRSEILAWLRDAIAPRTAVPALLEIGAGIGRLTPSLQKISDKVVAVDFLPDLINDNKKNNGHRSSDEFLCECATKLSFPAASFDVVFWNWLMMYLTDEETKAFARKAISWLRPGGVLFCRESCEHASHNAARPWAKGGNPTKYRPVKEYTNILIEDARKSGFNLEVIFQERPVTIYEENVGTSNQRCWMLRRKE
eukprot:GHVT01094762.1.p1 GENE.GHVT01094762.1~~GHVT01094762.1.p1  ORF type:complete len:265 (-),score=37.66 GHVT01094762.1:1205-1999(-)